MIRNIRYYGFTTLTKITNPMQNPTETLNQPDVCMNCQTELYGRFCADCGQPRQTRIRSFGSLIMDFIESTFNYDSRLFRTIPLLLLKPGKLTNEYLQGHRMRYVPPLRMYLVISLIFFLIMSWGESSSPTNINIQTDNKTQSTEKPLPKENLPESKQDSVEPDNANISFSSTKETETAKKQSSKEGLAELKQQIAESENFNISFLNEEENSQLRNIILEKVEKNSLAIRT